MTNTTTRIEISSVKPLESGSELPLVSVVLGNYNYGRFIRQSIESVLNQSYQRFELIVVDDGSTDDSRSIIQSYGDRVIPIFQKNLGQEAAFNAGIQASKGEIICFLDADDYFHPDKLDRVVSCFNDHPEWAQIGHCWISVDSDNKPIGKSTSNLLSQGDVSQLLLRWGKYASTISSGLSCRRSVLEKVMPLQPGWGVDTYLNVAVPFYGTVGCINEPLMFYRMHGQNMRAYNDDLEYLIQQREAAAEFINRMAVQANVCAQFDLQRDPDYLSYKIMQDSTTPLLKRLYVVALSLQESRAIGRSWRDTFIRLVYRSFGALLPSQGKLLLRYGFRGYLRFKLIGKV